MIYDYSGKKYSFFKSSTNNKEEAVIKRIMEEKKRRLQKIYSELLVSIYIYYSQNSSVPFQIIARDEDEAEILKELLRKDGIKASIDTDNGITTLTVDLIKEIKHKTAEMLSNNQNSMISYKLKSCSIENI